MSFYWYERMPDLLKAEKELMARHFPEFRMERLSDGRLCWTGTVNPSGKHGLRWKLLAVYDHNHPHNSTWGGSIRVYSLDPDLKELSRHVGPIPHVLRDSHGNYYMCTARPEDFDNGKKKVSTAAKSLGFAITWIFIFERWLEGMVGDEIYREVY